LLNSDISLTWYVNGVGGLGGGGDEEGGVGLASFGLIFRVRLEFRAI
jgi:hypothetical protein